MVASCVVCLAFLHPVAEAERLARPDKTDLPALALRAWPVLHRLGPLFLATFELRAAPAAASTLRAVELLRAAYDSSGRRWPGSLPVSFLQPAWRDAVLDAPSAGGTERRTWPCADHGTEAKSPVRTKPFRSL